MARYASYDYCRHPGVSKSTPVQCQLTDCITLQCNVSSQTASHSTRWQSCKSVPAASLPLHLLTGKTFPLLQGQRSSRFFRLHITGMYEQQIDKKQNAAASGSGTLPESLGLLLGAPWALPATEGVCAGCPCRQVGALVEAGRPTHPAALAAGAPKASSLHLPCLRTQTGRCVFPSPYSNTNINTTDPHVLHSSQELRVGSGNKAHDRSGLLSGLTAK